MSAFGKYLVHATIYIEGWLDYLKDSDIGNDWYY